MVFFFAFVFYLIGLCGNLFSPFLLLLALGPLGYLWFYKKEKRCLFLLLFLILGYVLLFLLPKGRDSLTSLYGICVYRKDTYYLVLSWTGKYYVQDRQNLVSLFSIVHLTGKSSEVSSMHYESVFYFDDYLKSHGVFYQFKPKKTTFLFKNPISNIGYKNFLFSYLEEQPRIFVSSLLTGDSLYSLGQNKALKELGILSNLSLSGFHLSFFLRLVTDFLNEKQKKAFSYIELGILGFFLFLSNFKYAIRRILYFRILNLISNHSKERLTRLDKVSLVAFVFLFFEPYSLLSGAFYYPFSLLFVLALFPTKIRKDIKSKIKFLIFLGLFYLPLRMIENPSFSLLSPLVQLLSVPLSHVLFLLSLLLIICPPIGFILNYPINGILFLSSKMGVTSLSIPTGSPNVVFFLVYYSFFLIALIMRAYCFNKFVKISLSGVILTFSTSLIPDFLPHEEVTFVDVGQGDCTLIRYQRENILIDTGGSKRVDIANECLIPYFQKQKITSLDAVIITHPDFDHNGALEPLTESFSVKNTFTADDFLSAKDNTIDFKGLQIRDYNLYGRDTGEEDNNTVSGVYQFTIHRKTFLIMGDAPKEIEKKIISGHPEIRCDVLKVGHHGSNTSSSKEFLETVQPRLAIISCGKANTYGHPHKETINTLESLSIPYRRTDLEGSITIRC